MVVVVVVVVVVLVVVDERHKIQITTSITHMHTGNSNVKVA